MRSKCAARKFSIEFYRKSAGSKNTESWAKNAWKKKKWLEREVATLATVQLVTSSKAGEQVIKLLKFGLIVIRIKLTAFWNIYCIFSLKF